MTIVWAFLKRWRITIAYLLIVASFLYAYHLNDEQNTKRSDAQCASITQVKEAALRLTKLASKRGVTDPATLARIDVSNAAKLEARKKLERSLACRR